MIQEKVAEIEDVEKLRNLSVLLAVKADAESSVSEELAGALRIACYLYGGLSLIQLINIGCLVFAKRKDRVAEE